MGKINQGILGGFSGKVGNVIGATWNGIDYMRIMPSSVANPKSEGQLDQRSKFVVVLTFLQPLVEFLRIGFKAYGRKMSEFNSAMSYNLRNAITGTYPNYEIDFTKSLISRGKLRGVLNPAAVSNSPGAVKFTWDDNSFYHDAYPTDKSMVIVYSPTQKDAVFMIDGADRSTEEYTLTVPDALLVDPLHAYIAFITEDGRYVSKSKYIGIVSVI